MYICICKAVTDKQILQAQEEGCQSIDAITQYLGVGTGCGNCIEQAEDLLMKNAGVQHFSSLQLANLPRVTV